MCSQDTYLASPCCATMTKEKWKHNRQRRRVGRSRLPKPVRSSGGSPPSSPMTRCSEGSAVMRSKVLSRRSPELRWGRPVSDCRGEGSNLLYLVVKSHPLLDGNKRSAAALFVTFLARNGVLNSDHGSPRISNNALAAITLMVAMSDPKEKDLMIALLVRMLVDQSQ